MPFVKVQGEKVFYASHGSGGCPVVLIHGAGGSHLVWPQQIRRLEGAATFALDLPGHGKSGGAGATRIEAYAEHIRDFLQAVGLKRAVLAGHSMGGAIAQMVALKYPEVVQALVLLATGARLRVAPAILDGLRSDFEATVLLVADWAHGPQATDEVRSLGIQTMLAAGADVLHGDFAACDAFDVTQRLGDIRVPTLALCGSEDRMTPPKYSEALAAGIPDASVATVDGAGHTVMLEAPRRTAELVAAFLRQVCA